MGKLPRSSFRLDSMILALAAAATLAFTAFASETGTGRAVEGRQAPAGQTPAGQTPAGGRGAGQAPAGGRGAGRGPAQGGAGPLKVLFVSKGHPFDREGLFSTLDALGTDITWTHVEEPAA